MVVREEKTHIISLLVYCSKKVIEEEVLLTSCITSAGITDLNMKKENIHMHKPKWWWLAVLVIAAFLLGSYFLIFYEYEGYAFSKENISLSRLPEGMVKVEAYTINYTHGKYLKPKKTEFYYVQVLQFSNSSLEEEYSKKF